VTACAAKSKSCLYVECTMRCYASSLPYSQLRSYSVTIMTEPEGSLHDFSNVNPLLPPVMASVRPYFQSSIQSEAPNDTPNIYDITAVEEQHNSPSFSFPCMQSTSLPLTSSHAALILKHIYRLHMILFFRAFIHRHRSHLYGKRLHLTLIFGSQVHLFSTLLHCSTEQETPLWFPQWMCL
jgi:hypothetical protein